MHVLEKQIMTTTKTLSLIREILWGKSNKLCAQLGNRESSKENKLTEASMMSLVGVKSEKPPDRTLCKYSEQSYLVSSMAQTGVDRLKIIMS